MACAFLVGPAGPVSAAGITWTGDQTVSDDQSYTGETITLSGNLTITGTLTLSGTELRLECPENGALGIFVENGGTFNVLANSTIRSTNAGAHFRFAVGSGGTLRMNASLLRDCGWYDDWNGTTGLFDQGLYVESDSVWITNSTLTANYVGVTVVNSTSPFIYRNNITDNDCSGVEVYNSATPVIDHNLIKGNMRHAYWYQGGGILSELSSPIITNNTITANIDLYSQYYTWGIYLSTGGSPVIADNEISNHKGGYSYWTGGIGGWGSSPTIRRNNITGNSNGIDVNAMTGTVEDNLIDSNKVQGYASYGYGVYDDGGSTFANNTYTRNNIGVMVVDGSSSTYQNETLTSNSRAGVDTDTWGRGYDVTMTNCTFSKNGYDVYLEGNSGGGAMSTLTLVNPSYNPVAVRVTDAGASLKVKWFLRARVLWENGSRVVEGAAVNATTSKGVTTAEATTGPDGWTGSMLLEEYSRTSGGTNYKTPYNISALSGDKRNFTAGVALTSNRNVTVMLDDIAPPVQITSPTDGFLTNLTTIKVKGLTEPGVTLSVNGVSADIRSDGNWTAMVPLENDGANELVAAALDAGLNKASDRITVYRDTVVPTLSVTAPKNNFLVNRTGIFVDGKTSDASAATTVNGLPVAVQEDGSFRALYNLTEGQNTLVVETRDPAGNHAQVIIAGELDTIPPAVQVLEPRNGLVTNRTTMWIKGNVEEGAGLTLNGRNIRADRDSFSYEATLEEGSNVFTFGARDKAGNTNSSMVVITKDTLPPPLVVLFPTNDLLVNYTLLEVRGTTEAGAMVRVNDLIADFEGTAFCFTLELYEGPNTITVEAFDSQRNGVQKVLNVNVDTIAPPLNLLNPRNNNLTNQTSVEVRGRTDVGSIVKVNGARTWIDKDGLFSVTVTLEQEGANRITVTASDIAGNTEQAAVTVIRDTVVNYTLSSPVNGAQVKTKNITVSGRAEPGSSVVLSGVGSSMRPDGSFYFDVTLTDGPNLLLLTITDKAGNVAVEELTITKLKAAKPAPSKGFIPGFEMLLALAAMGLSAAILLHRKR